MINIDHFNKELKFIEVKQVQKHIKIFSSMNKSFGSKSNMTDLTFDKSPSKSTKNKLSKTLSETRQIIIKTKQPDIPQITIYKVQRQRQFNISKAMTLLQKFFQQKQLISLFGAMRKISMKNQLVKLQLANLNKLSIIMKAKQKRQMTHSWQKILNQRLKFKSKINSGRLISKISMFIVNRINQTVINKMKEYRRKQLTEIPKLGKIQKKVSIPIENAEIKNQEYSEKFINACKKFTNIKNTTLANNAKIQLETSISNELQRYKQLRTKKTTMLNNQIVILTLNNFMLTTTNLRNDLQTTINKVKQLEKKPTSTEQLSQYQKIQKQLQKADTQLRQSIQKNKKIQQKQFIKILENQYKLWDKFKISPLYNSRLFISAIMMKLIKDNSQSINQFMDSIEGILAISTDIKKMEQYKKTFKGKDRSNSVISAMANKFIELHHPHTFGMTPITQHQFSQNQQSFMSEIKDIKNQIRDFVNKFTVPHQKRKMRKIFQVKKPTSSEQLRDLYVALNDLINLIQNNDEQKLKDSKVKQLINKNDVLMKILLIFKECLNQSNYNKWQNFINTQVDRSQYHGILTLLDQINDIVNDKILNQCKQVTDQLTRLQHSQIKTKQQNDTYRTKTSTLQKKIKSFQLSRSLQSDSMKLSSSSIKQKQKQLQQLKQKYLQINHLFNQMEINKNLEIDDIKHVLNNTNLQLREWKQRYQQINLSSSHLETSIRKQLAQVILQLDQKNKSIREFQQIKNNNNNISQSRQKQMGKLTGRINQQNMLLEQWEQKYKNMNNEHNKLELSLRKQLFDLNQKLLPQQQQIANLKQTNKKNKIAYQQLQKDYNSLLNKSHTLSLTIQDLKKQLQLLSPKKQQNISYQKDTYYHNIPVSSTPIRDKNVWRSLELIKELNKQLEKLKKSQNTIRQLSHSYPNIHQYGSKYHSFTSSIKNQLQTSFPQHKSMDKNQIIYNLQNHINLINSQLINLKNNNQQLKRQLQESQIKYKKIEQLLKEKQKIIENNNLLYKELQSKKQIKINIIEKNQIHGQTQSNNKNTTDQQQIKTLDDALTELRMKSQLIQQLYEIIKKKEEKMNNLKQNNEQYIQNLLLHIQKSQQLITEKNQQIKILSQSQLPQNLSLIDSTPQIQKPITQKQSTITTQRQTLKSKLRQLTTINHHLQSQLSTLPTSQIYLQNIILLLTNTITNFIRINPKPNLQFNSQISQQVHNDLTNIKNKYARIENQMFAHFQNYVVEFMEADIGKYRFQLSLRIQQLSSLKQRLSQFITRQTQYSKSVQNSRLQFDKKQHSTADGNNNQLLGTPINYLVRTPTNPKKMAYKINQEIDEKTLEAKKLF